MGEKLCKHEIEEIAEHGLQVKALNVREASRALASEVLELRKRFHAAKALIDGYRVAEEAIITVASCNTIETRLVRENAKALVHKLLDEYFDAMRQVP